jgi:hypothetical protein
VSAVLAAAGPLVLADSDTGKGSPIGFLVVLVLVIAVYFLYRSMNRHLKNVPDTFDPMGQVRVPEPAEPAQPAEPVEQADLAGPDATGQPGEAVPAGDAVAGETDREATPVTPREPGPDQP